MFKLVIDNDVFEVDFVSLQRTATFEDKYGIVPMEDGTMQRELIGVRYRYDLQIGFERYNDEYERLFDALSIPKSYKIITVPDHNSSRTKTFRAYQEQVADETDGMWVDMNGKTYWKNLTTTFTAQRPVTK